MEFFITNLDLNQDKEKKFSLEIGTGVLGVLDIDKISGSVQIFNAETYSVLKQK